MNLFITRYLSPDESFFLHHTRKQGSLTMTNDHIHDNYEIYYLISGERNYFIKDRVYLIKKGDLVLIPKYVIHKTLDAGAAEYERVVLNFKDKFIERYQESHVNLVLPFQQGRYKLSLSVPDQDFVETLFHRMIKETKSRPLGFELYLKVLTVELLLFINRCVEKNDHNDLLLATPLHRKISEIASYINDNYMQHLTLSGLSERFYISNSYLSSLFKEISGFSITEYLNRVRVKEAQKLLRETHLKIYTIAVEVGFSSIAHFGRVFKQLTKLSPQQYRNMNRQKG